MRNIVENGQIVLAKGCGYADVAAKVPATADTPFRAGSISMLGIRGRRRPA